MQTQGVVVVALLLAACGGKGSTGDDTDGGRGGTGGHTNGASGRSNDSGDDSDASAGDTFQPVPAAQGAFAFSVKAPSPVPRGKTCPTSAGFTSDVPEGNGPTANSYLAHVVDGEEGAVVSCRVAGDTSFEISGEVRLAGRGLIIEDGAVSADKHGSASITIIDSQYLSTKLRGISCLLDVGTGPTSNLQIKKGSVWASFYCSSVESPPNDYCQASGFVVLENCAQE